MKDDLSRDDLYESVKTLVGREKDSKNHFHFNQHKLYTLFSIGFNYLLYNSTKNPGIYIIRIEGNILAEKLAKKSKDSASRKFLESLLIPKKLIYKGSTFYLDFFQIGSWNRTKDLPKGKVKGAIIVKNTTKRPLEMLPENVEDENSEAENSEAQSQEETLLSNLPKDFYISSLTEFVPKVILVAYEEDDKSFEPVTFPFIKKEKERPAKGVTISSDINFDNFAD